MNGVDYLFVAIVLISTTTGIFRGFVREAISLLGWLVGIWLAWQYAYLLDPYLGGALAAPELREWAGRIILLLVFVFAASALGSLVAHLLHRASGLAATDRFVGALFGLIRALVAIGVFVMAGRGLDLTDEDWWTRSTAMPWAEHVADWLERYAEPAVEPLLKEASELLRR
jgi:membrane protein required for colicin V production